MDDSRFTGEMVKVGHKPIDNEKLKKIKLVHGGQGSGDVEGHEFRGNQYSGLSTKTYQMTDSIKMSSRQKLSESIVDRFPPKTEWKDPRAYEIAEIAARSFSSNGTQLIAAEDKDNKIQGLVSFYPDPDGVNITYIASTGNVRHTGTDLLKKAIDSNPGKDVNLYADPGAKTYYAHLGMHMVDDGGEGRGATFHWSADEAKKFSSIPKETMNIVSRLLSMITKKMVHGGEGSGEKEGHEFRGNQWNGIVKDSGVNWDIKTMGEDKVGIQNKKAIFSWVSTDTFIDMQYSAAVKGGTTSSKERFLSVASPDRVEELKSMMSSGNIFQSFAVEYDSQGKIKDFQEGRHRALAAKELGIKKLPVWFFIDRPKIGGVYTKPVLPGNLVRSQDRYGYENSIALEKISGGP